jgi:hypothetical protein
VEMRCKGTKKIENMELCPKKISKIKTFSRLRLFYNYKCYLLLNERINRKISRYGYMYKTDLVMR